MQVELLSWKSINELTDDGGVSKTTVAEGERWEQPKDADEVLGTLRTWLSPEKTSPTAVPGLQAGSLGRLTCLRRCACAERRRGHAVSYKVTLPDGTLLKEAAQQEFDVVKGAAIPHTACHCSCASSPVPHHWQGATAEGQSRCAVAAPCLGLARVLKAMKKNETALATLKAVPGGTDCAPIRSGPPLPLCPDSRMMLRPAWLLCAPAAPAPPHSGAMPERCRGVVAVQTWRGWLRRQRSKWKSSSTHGRFDPRRCQGAPGSCSLRLSAAALLLGRGLRVGPGAWSLL